MLPPLLYASAEEMSWRELRAAWKPVSVLVVGLVLASAAVVGYVASVLTPLSWQMALVLGAVLASTDPVAVTALGRRLALPPRVQVMVQAESLFNDATSLVLFRVAVGVAVASSAVSWGGAAGEFGLLAGGGTLIGGAVAGAVVLIRRRTRDPVLETVIALVTPYAAYVLAETAHTSGVTSVVVAGVVMGGSGDRLGSARIRLQLHAVYGTVVFLLESVVFSLIGLSLPGLMRKLGADNRLWPLYALALACTLVAVRVQARTRDDQSHHQPAGRGDPFPSAARRSWVVPRFAGALEVEAPRPFRFRGTFTQAGPAHAFHQSAAVEDRFAVEAPPDRAEQVRTAAEPHQPRDHAPRRDGQSARHQRNKEEQVPLLPCARAGPQRDDHCRLPRLGNTAADVVRPGNGSVRVAPEGCGESTLCADEAALGTGQLTHDGHFCIPRQ